MPTTEATGPLTEAELKELTEHRFYPESAEETQKDLDWHTNVLNNTSKGDPVFKRFTSLRIESQRYLHLLQRHDASQNQPGE
jgi:hypothetical protein